MKNKNVVLPEILFRTAVLSFGIYLVACSAMKVQSGYKNLAVASDTVAHSIKNVEDALNLAVQNKVMTQKEKADYDEYVIKVSQAGMLLDKAIRDASTTNATLSDQVNAFLGALQQLSTQVLGIRDANTRLALATAISGAESAVAVIAAQVQKKGP